MINMANRSMVLMADLKGITPYSVMPTGVVLARSHGEYVVWNVALRTDTVGNDQGVWDAYNGDYFNYGDDLVSDDLALADAIKKYDQRRGM